VWNTKSLMKDGGVFS